MGTGMAFVTGKDVDNLNSLWSEFKAPFPEPVYNLCPDIF